MEDAEDLRSIRQPGIHCLAVCRHSLLRHSSPDLEVYPPSDKPEGNWALYTPHGCRASNAFSISCFLTPDLAAHEGWSVFVDCDFLFTGDVRKVIRNLIRQAVLTLYSMIIAYFPSMDGRRTMCIAQRRSSFIVFNMRHAAVKALTPHGGEYSQPLPCAVRMGKG